VSTVSFQSPEDEHDEAFEVDQVNVYSVPTSTWPDKSDERFIETDGIDGEGPELPPPPPPPPQLARINVEIKI
jgi:hypothetical protein